MFPVFTRHRGKWHSSNALAYDSGDPGLNSNWFQIHIGFLKLIFIQSSLFVVWKFEPVLTQVFCGSLGHLGKRLNSFTYGTSQGSPFLLNSIHLQIF